MMAAGCPARGLGSVNHSSARGFKSVNMHEDQVPASGAARSPAGARSVAQIRREGNHLRDEQSLYLRQHAFNPVDWRPWGEAALALAREQDRPVFLSIGYSSCHWCHVMEEEVFENDEIAAFLNGHFVCIKVDREERPDIDAAYMKALQLMTGSGGWPLSMFLTSDLKPFFGATYIPPEQFLPLIKQISGIYYSDRENVEQAGSQLRELVSSDAVIAGPAAEIPSTLPAKAVAEAEAAFDPAWGGFGAQQKFPTPPRWRFLLHYYRLTEDEQVGDMLRLTLDRMGDGGIHDHIGGGFHRYTVEPSWLIPHFEKMLYDNAQLATLYLEASVVFGSERYAQIARDTLEFMLAEMQNPAGGFYASFDADSGGEEGSFYVWSPAELNEVAGEQDGAALAILFGVTDSGNFAGKSVLTRRVSNAEIARQSGLSGAEAAGLVDKWRTSLYQNRETRTPPELDRKVVSAWNGLAIEALALGYCVLGDERYRQAAEQAAEYIGQMNQAEDGALFRASTGGVAGSAGILDDYGLLAGGLLSLYEMTGKMEHLKRALALLDYAREHFAHPEAGFYLTADDVDAPLGRQVQLLDSVEPSGNAALLAAMLRAGALTGNSDYSRETEAVLKAYVAELDRAGLEMAAWQDVALLSLNPYYTVMITGDAEDSRTQELLKAASRHAAPYALLVQLPAGGASADLLELMPAAIDKVAVGGLPTAYVCRQGSCQAPTSDPAELKRQMLSGWQR